MHTKTIQNLLIIMSLISFSCQADNKIRTVFKTAAKGAQSIGVYKRAKIGNDGAYGTFTQKGTVLSQTVIEHIPANNDQKAIGYILNTNSTNPAYIGLYPYKEAIPQVKKTSASKPSMPMKTAKYTQKS